MRKNRMMRLASALLILTMVTTCAISGTFAKYTSTSTASDTARVAKWSFTVNGTDIATTAMTFNLFDTIKDSGGANEETDVSTGKIVAPGTAGSFKIQLKNASEVKAVYSIAYEASTTAIPLEYSLDGSDWKADIQELNVTSKELAIGTSESDIIVYWRWCFDHTSCAVHSGWGDTNDTSLGVAAVAADQNIKITATITATQVD